MPRGDKSSYSSKQRRKAEHVEEGYEKKGVSTKEAERRAWATVNKQDGGAKGEGGRKRASSSGGRKRASSSGGRKRASSSGGRKRESA